ncbi:hypothetical protein IAU59_004373 [Kwoniella sp. CBS 9459]
MKAPKRTPWADQAELEELYEMLFAPSADPESRRSGIARMSIYISSPSCPTFIHLLHSLVSLELLPYPPPNIEDAQRLRLGLGMGIVRFVNSLVDPLQTGPYARPISHLAATLALPPALISLRHRATHEDLPPPSLLHSALGQCISYLHHYSFLPLLSSSSSSANADGGGGAGRLPPGMAERLEASKKRVESLVKRWKRVQKVRLREKEVREEDETALEVRRIKKALEVEDGRVIVDVLVSQGGLVPIADKKRAPLKSSLPPTPSLKIWLPLLQHLASISHPDLSATLSSRILDVLLNPDSQLSSDNVYGNINANASDGGLFMNMQTTTGVTGTSDDRKQAEQSFRWGLATWLNYLWAQGRSRPETSTAQEASMSEALSGSGPGPSPLAMSAEDKLGSLRRILGALLDLHEDVVIRKLYSSLVDQPEHAAPLAASSSSSQTASHPHDNLMGLMDLLPSEGEDNEEGEQEPELHGLEIDMDDEDTTRRFGAGAEPGSATETEEYAGLSAMEDRLAQFEELLSARKAAQLPKPSAADQYHRNSDIEGVGRIDLDIGLGPARQHQGDTEEQEQDQVVVPGWRRLTADEWRACPIGCAK